MLDWKYIILSSFIYIGIFLSAAFLIWCAFIGISRCFKKNLEKNQKMEKEHKKLNKSKYETSSIILSDSDTQSVCLQVGNPNKHSYRTDESRPAMNSSQRYSFDNTFINVPDKSHMTYTDSRSLLHKEDSFEDTSEDETDVCEEMYLQRESCDSRQQLISSKLNKSMRNMQSKYRNSQPDTTYSNSSKRKQYKCNRNCSKSHIVQKNVIEGRQPTGNRNNFDYASLTIDPVQVIPKYNKHKIEERDKANGISPMKYAANSIGKPERDTSTHKFQQYNFDNNLECTVNSANVSPFLKIPEKGPTHTFSKDRMFVSEMQNTICFPHDRYNTEETSKHNRDFRAPLFQNSNIPIAKRVLEDDQFYDLRQKFCSAENTSLTSPKPVKDEQSFNRWNTEEKQNFHLDEKSYPVRCKKYSEEDNYAKHPRIRYTEKKQNVQPDEKSYSVRCKKYSEEDNYAKYPRIRYASHFTGESGDGNPTSDVPSPSDSSDIEEVVCDFWKKLKVGKKRSKGIQGEFGSVRSDDAELLLPMHTNKTQDFYKYNSEEPTQNKQDIAIGARSTTVTKNRNISAQNQISQINRNQKLCPLIESSQIETMERHPNLYSAQVSELSELRHHAENRTCRNCKSFLQSGDDPKERFVHSRPILVQTESYHPLHEHLRSDYTQLTENTKNIRYCDNSYLSPNFKRCENMSSRYNLDCELPNEDSVCNATVPISYFENHQYLNAYNDTRQRQMQRMYTEQENMPLSNHFVQQKKCKHGPCAPEKNYNYSNEQMPQQIGDSQLPNFHKSPNEMLVTNHQYIPNNNYINGPNSRCNSWGERNTVFQENVVYDRNKDFQNEDNLSHSIRNIRQKMDVKAVHSSDSSCIPQNRTEEYFKRPSKEIPKKSHSRINSWRDGNTVSQENVFYGRNRDIQKEDDSRNFVSHNTKNNRHKFYDGTEMDAKVVQTSEVIWVPQKHTKEYNKQTSKEMSKKPKSQIKIDAEEAVEKSSAAQLQAKENVLKQIKRMYSHMDPNIHETNTNVITQVKKVLKSKGMWHSEK